uniref:Uncharacterized protein n=1 Tax=Lactuca sativa TaxID=4236 RepID=A0A9R1VZJ6_LACSA|nr:hypothetical protein LSAT_V11C400212140 [Lactuca sativa]
MARLNNRPVYGAMFTKSCFGDYLNIHMGVEGHPLVNILLGHRLAVQGVSPPSSGFREFRQHMFPFVLLSCSVRVAELIHMINNLRHQLSNADAVIVSLLFMLEQEF